MNLTQALGWTLIHFLWQGVAVAVALACVLFLLRRSTPAARYAASCVAMLLMLLSAAGTFVNFATGNKTLSAAASSFQPLILNSELVASSTVLRPVASLSDYLPLFVWAWFGGVLALSLRSLGGWAFASRFARIGTSPAESFWEERFVALVQRLRISRPVKLAVSSAARVPAVVGWAKPVVLMPATIFTGLTVDQIEALLAHELAHVRRHDYAINLLQTAVETLLFYHPAVWWVGRSIRTEREHCCDDLAVEICGNPATYVRALADLEQLLGATPSFAMGADGGSLIARVERLLRLRPHAGSTPSSSLAIIAVAAICISVIGVEARSFRKPQQPAVPEVAQALPAEPAPESEPPTEVASAEVAQARPAATPAPQQDSARQATSSGWLDQIEAAGFKGLPVDKLIELRIHGVDGKYIQEIRAAGFDPSVDKLIELKIHGIDGEFMKQLRATGLQLSIDKMLEVRIHGVDSNFIQGIRSAGYPDISIDKILEMKIHGVTPDYIREAKSHFKDITLDQILQLKIHGILN